MNKRKDEECMTAFLDSVIVNGVQDPSLTPFEEFPPRSAPLVDFLGIGLHSGAGWKYPSANTTYPRNPERQRFILPDVEGCRGEGDNCRSKFS